MTGRRTIPEWTLLGGGAVVKVTTDQAGLYGYGCATATFPGGRAKLAPPR